MAKKDKKGKQLQKAEKKEKKLAQKEIYKRKLAGLIIGLIGVFLLVFIVFYTISRVFRPQDLAVMLPKDNVVALMQISVNQRHEQVQRYYEALNRHDIYHPNNVSNLISEILDVDYSNEIDPWLNRQIGLALLEKNDESGEIDVLLFAETSDRGETVEFMQSRGLTNQEDYVLSDDYRGTDIYRYALSQTFNFMFVNNYLVIANNENALKKVVDANLTSNGQLKNNETYQKVSQNLPINTLVFSYVDFKKAINMLKGNEEFMSEKGKELLAFEPFLKLYKAFGLTAVMENGNLAVQTFSSLDQDYLDGRDFINFNNKFRANLLELIPEDLKFYAGGLDLKKQIQRYADLFSAGGEVSYLIFEGMLRAQKNTYLGSEIDLEEDIYPLLQGEYALAINGEDEKRATTLLLELADPLRDRDKIESIADSFVRKSAVLAPKIVEVELEDGTILEEIQTVPEEIIRSTEDYRGYEMNILTVGQQPWGIYYLIMDDVLTISTKKNNLQKSIDLFVDSQGSVKNSYLYRELISPILRTSDEVLFFDTDFILSSSTELVPEWMTPYLEPFAFVSAGKNYFKDGISTIHYIKID